MIFGILAWGSEVVYINFRSHPLKGDLERSINKSLVFGHTGGAQVEGNLGEFLLSAQNLNSNLRFWGLNN